ncbi:MAG: hypothetical protein NVS9B9_18810 [Ktedonobacteraceae bacterium]
MADKNIKIGVGLDTKAASDGSFQKIITSVSNFSKKIAETMSRSTTQISNIQKLVYKENLAQFKQMDEQLKIHHANFKKVDEAYKAGNATIKERNKAFHEMNQQYNRTTAAHRTALVSSPAMNTMAGRVLSGAIGPEAASSILGTKMGSFAAQNPLTLGLFKMLAGTISAGAKEYMQQGNDYSDAASKANALGNYGMALKRGDFVRMRAIRNVLGDTNGLEDLKKTTNGTAATTSNLIDGATNFVGGVATLNASGVSSAVYDTARNALQQDSTLKANAAALFEKNVTAMDAKDRYFLEQMPDMLHRRAGMMRRGNTGKEIDRVLNTGGDLGIGEQQTWGVQDQMISVVGKKAALSLTERAMEALAGGMRDGVVAHIAAKGDAGGSGGELVRRFAALGQASSMASAEQIGSLVADSTIGGWGASSGLGYGAMLAAGLGPNANNQLITDQNIRGANLANRIVTGQMDSYGSGLNIRAGIHAAGKGASRAHQIMLSKIPENIIDDIMAGGDVLPYMKENGITREQVIAANKEIMKNDEATRSAGWSNGNDPASKTRRLVKNKWHGDAVAYIKSLDTEEKREQAFNQLGPQIGLEHNLDPSDGIGFLRGQVQKAIGPKQFSVGVLKNTLKDEKGNGTLENIELLRGTGLEKEARTFRSANEGSLKQEASEMHKWGDTVKNLARMDIGIEDTITSLGKLETSFRETAARMAGLPVPVAPKKDLIGDHETRSTSTGPRPIDDPRDQGHHQ